MHSSTLAIALLAVQVASADDARSAAPADSILRNGRILVFSGPERHERTDAPKFEQALAIRDGRIVYIGTNEQTQSFAGPKTVVTDLRGRMVMPGIVDGHFHGTRAPDCAMGYEGGTIPQILAKLQACLDRPDQAVHKGTNVGLYASQFFGDAVLPRGTSLTRDDLDRLVTTRPIHVRNADGHKFWMNSRAIENAGIDATTPIPLGGQIGRDASGRPNGFFADMDVDNWGDIAEVPESQRVDLVRRTIADANRMGLTSVFVPGGNQGQQIARWAKVQDEGGLTLRANLGFSASFVHETPDLAELKKLIAALDDDRKYAKGLISVTSRQSLLRRRDGTSGADGSDAEAIQRQLRRCRQACLATRHVARSRSGLFKRKARVHRARQGWLADPRPRDRRPCNARSSRQFRGCA